MGHTSGTVQQPTPGGGSTDPDKIVQALTIEKLQRENEKTLQETENLRRAIRTEAIRFFVPIIAPLISALAVVAALVFQTFQFRQTSDVQRQTVAIQKQTAEIQARAAEDAQWHAAVSTFTADPKSSTSTTRSWTAQT